VVATVGALAAAEVDGLCSLAGIVESVAAVGAWCP
jgi:hypothetical protein